MRRLIALLGCCIGLNALAQSSDPALLQSVVGELSHHQSVRADFTKNGTTPR